MALLTMALLTMALLTTYSCLQPQDGRFSGSSDAKRLYEPIQKGRQGEGGRPAHEPATKQQPAAARLIAVARGRDVVTPRPVPPAPVPPTTSGEAFIERIIW